MSRVSHIPTADSSLRATQYDRVSSGLIAIVFCLACLVAVLTMFLSGVQFQAPKVAVPVQLALEPEDPGGTDDGTPGESLQLDSDMPLRADATTAEKVEEDKSDVKDILEEVSNQDQVVEIDRNVAANSSAAPGESSPSFEFATPVTGRPGSSQGTGKKTGWGRGTGKGGGYPREERWFVGFSDTVTVKEYARQLDFFQIELGALMPDGKIYYVSNLSDPNPQKREATSGKDEKRLYFTWRGGGRRLADLELLRKAGLNPDEAVVMQFYDPNTENMLAQLELDYQNQKANTIRRTYFAIEPDTKGGYRFVVTKQITYKDVQAGRG
ncbi:MAG: hypothetical protein U0903_02920 [Planctomycetales bacterium]